MNMSDKDFERTHACRQLADTVQQAIELVVDSIEAREHQVDGFVDHSGKLVDNYGKRYSTAYSCAADGKAGKVTKEGSDLYLKSVGAL